MIVPEIAFRNDFNFRLRRTNLEADDEPRSRSEFEEAPELIASLQGLENSIVASPTELSNSDRSLKL